MRVIDGTDLVFSHIPKTAGQAVMRAFGLDPDPDRRGTAHTLEREERDRFLGPGWIRFSVVRDPVDRFVSAYRYHLRMIEAGEVNDKPIRLMIAEHGLGGDVNAFVAHLRRTGFDLQRDLHLRKQTSFLRLAKPQITLRHETLDHDIRIVAAFAPDRFEGLARVNVSGPACAARGPVLELDAASLEFLDSFYAMDFRMLGYLRPVRRGRDA
jgi:hypothetical protein